MDHAPISFELSAAEREGNERFLLNLFLSDPRGKNTDAESEFNELLDRFHAPELDHRVQDHVFLTEVILNHPEGVAVLVVENVLLPRNLGTHRMTFPGPR